MKVEFIKTFLTVAETGSFTKTAKELHLSQSTVSNRIQELEREIGKALFIRFHSHVELTIAGKIFIPYAEKMILIETQAIEKVNTKDTYSERLIVGCVHSFYDSFLSNIIKEYIIEFPHISLKIVLNHSRDIISGVMDGIFDIGYTYHPYYNPDYCCKLINKEDMILVTNGKNREYDCGISISNIKKIPIFYSSFLDSNTFDWLFGKHHLFQLEIDIGSKIISFISDGNKYTFLPRKLIEKQLNEEVLIEVPFLDFNIPPLENCILYNKNNIKRHSIQNFIKLTQGYFSQ